MKDGLLKKHDGDRMAAAVELAEGLMRGDPTTFKAGYSLENAVHAAAEMFRSGVGEVAPWHELVTIAAEVGRRQGKPNGVYVVFDHDAGEPVQAYTDESEAELVAEALGRDVNQTFEPIDDRGVTLEKLRPVPEWIYELALALVGAGWPSVAADVLELVRLECHEPEDVPAIISGRLESIGEGMSEAQELIANAAPPVTS